MRYLLDANAVIAMLRDPVGRVALRARRERLADVAVSAIVMHELFYGAFKSNRSARNVELVERLRFKVVEFDLADARKAGEIRAALETKVSGIGAYDLLIAGQAAARSLILVTHNTREFRRVPGLRLEDWEA